MHRGTWATAALLAAAALGLPAAALLAARAEPVRRQKADVPLDQVPPAVVAAAEKRVEGFTLHEAKRRVKKSSVVFKLEGTAGGREYAFKIDSSGKVLDLEDQGRDGRRARARARRGRTVPTERLPADARAPETAGPTPAVRIGWLGHESIRESSGVVASEKNPGVFWTHNDKGNAPVLYAVRADGTLLAEYPVAAQNTDWEDIALDDRGNLYVGNIGNNKARRDWLEVHRLREPFLGPELPGEAVPRASLAPDKTWRLRFPAEPFDCESLVVHARHGYVISKLFNGRSAGLYRFALDGPAEAVLEKVADLPVRSPVTGADLSPDARQLAVLSTGGLFLFHVDEGLRPIAGSEPRRVPVPPGKLEGVCFAGNDLLLTSEGREVYRVPQ